MEIHVIYKLDFGEEIPKYLKLDEKTIERLKEMHPGLKAVSVTAVGEGSEEDSLKKFQKNRLTN